MSSGLLAPPCHIVDLLSVTIFVMLVVLAGGLILLTALRVILSRKEARLEASKERIRPLVLDLLTREQDLEGAAWKVKHLVPAAEYSALEQVLQENARIVKGPEMDILTHIFETMGYVDEDIENVSSAKSITKARSAFHLGIMGSKRAVPDLLKALDDPDEQVVFAALDSLAHIGTPEAINGVMDFISGDRAIQNARVAEVVLEKKRAFAPLIRQRLVEGKYAPERLALLIDLAGAMHDAEAAPVLEGYLSGHEDSLRAKAARSIGLTGDFTRCGILVSALADGSADVRAAAAESLGKLECTDAIGPLARAVQDPELRVKMRAAVALTKLGEAGHAALTERLARAESQERGVVAEVLGTEDVRRSGMPGVSPT